MLWLILLEAIVVLVAIAALLSWVRWRIVNRKLLDFSDKVPGPPTIPILGNALTLMVPPEDLINVFGSLIQEYGDIFRLWLGFDMNVFVSDPDDIKTLLTSSKTSVKGPQYKYIADYCGTGILSGSGRTWRESRKAILPNYGKKSIESYRDAFNREANETVKRLSKKVGGGTFDIFDEVVKGTTYAVCQTLLGLTKEESLKLPELHTYVYLNHEMHKEVFMRMTTWYLQVEPFFRMTKYYQRRNKMLKTIQILGDAIVKHRLKVLETMDEDRKREILNVVGDNKHNTELCVVDRLVLCNLMPNYEELLKQLATVITSSQEATGKIATFFLLMMAFHPECQEKLYAEIKEVIGDSDRDVTDTDFKLMPYLEMVFKEVVRLFPIGVMLQRTIAEDITISKGTLPAGTSLVVPIFHLHRSPKHWINPQAFDPERFTPENSRLRHPNCYIPFSLGPMDCLGRYFASKLVKTMCVKVLREYRLSSPKKYEDMRLVMAVSVASVDGHPVRLHART